MTITSLEVQRFVGLPTKVFEKEDLSQWCIIVICMLFSVHPTKFIFYQGRQTDVFLEYFPFIPETGPAKFAVGNSIKMGSVYKHMHHENHEVAKEGRQEHFSPKFLYFG